MLKRKEENKLQEILGLNTKIERPLLGGMMNESYVVLSDGKKYVAYFPTAQANEMVDRKLEKQCHEALYNLGLTYKNIYFDVDKGIKINEFIEGSSLNLIDEYDVNEVANLFKKLHESKLTTNKYYEPFNKLIGYEKEAEGFIKDRDENYQTLRDTLFKNKELLESRPLTICHNDSQKSNVIKSNDNKYYFIDFEFMYDNDPIYDIAAFGNGKVSEGLELLKAYYKDDLDALKTKVFYLWRIFLSLQWHNVALIKHYRGEGKAHNIDFLGVANFFIENAKDAYNGLKDL